MGEAGNGGTGASANCTRSPVCTEAVPGDRLGCPWTGLGYGSLLIPLEFPPDGHQNGDERGCRYPMPPQCLHSGVALQLSIRVDREHQSLPTERQKRIRLHVSPPGCPCQPSPAFEITSTLPGRIPGALTSSSQPCARAYGEPGDRAPSSHLWLHLLGSPRVDKASTPGHTPLHHRS